jgi:hypothetical protein
MCMVKVLYIFGLMFCPIEISSLVLNYFTRLRNPQTTDLYTRNFSSVRATNSAQANSPEAEFFDVIETKVLRVFLLAIHIHISRLVVLSLYIAIAGEGSGATESGCVR